MFVDKATILIKAGDGGDGRVNFRQEKFVDKGGPDGGDGGKGGDVILEADSNVNTLVAFRYKQELTAENGEPGGQRKQHGRNGKDLIIKVPVGTQALSQQQVVTDLVAHGQRAIVAHGGDGGFGNAHFKSSTRQTPRVAELGEKGEEFTLDLELKLLADVGLVGFPNAGKSTFLSVVSNARPEIADYPFTTLTPHLGVADIDDTSLLIADIPGLIAGASQGKGLGDEFLRHIERTAVLLHLIDIYDDDVAASYRTIDAELQAYSDLASRPRIVALTKTEGLPEDGIAAKVAQLTAAIPPNTTIFTISAQAHQGLTDLLRELVKRVQHERQAAAAAAEAQEVQTDLPVIGLTDQQKDDAWRVTQDQGRFMVTGTKIEKFAARTNFDSEPGRRRLWDIMHKMGILHELERKRIEPGDVVVFGEAGRYTMKYGGF